MQPPAALVVSILDPAKNQRTRRAIETLEEDGWNVDVVSSPPSDKLKVSQVFNLGYQKLPILRGFEWPLRRFIFRAGFVIAALISGRDRLDDVAAGLGRLALDGRKVESLSGRQYQAIVVEDLLLLANVVRSDTSAKIIFDARDLYHQLHSGNFLWRHTVGKSLFWLTDSLIKKCAQVLSVSEALQRELHRQFGVKPEVIRSIPTRPPLAAKSGCRQTGERVKIVYSGRSDWNRGLSKVLFSFPRRAADLELHLFLAGPALAKIWLMAIGKGNPNIKFHRLVPPDQIIDSLAQFDLGLAVFPHSSPNLAGSLPNKFFEYLYAGLPVAVTKSTEMALTVAKYNCGFILQDSSVRTLRKFWRGIRIGLGVLGHKGVNRFTKDFSWELEGRRLVEIVSKAVSENVATKTQTLGKL